MNSEQELEGSGYYEGELDYSQDGSDHSTNSAEDGKEKFKKMLHKVLGVGESSQQVEKVCCFFRVNRKHSVARQLIQEYSLFLTLFMASLTAAAIFYVKFSPGFVGDSILTVADQSIEQSYLNSLLQYKTQVGQYLKAYRSWIILFIEIFSAQAGWHTSLYESATEMPLDPQGKYISVFDNLPNELIDPVYSASGYYNKPVSLETFSYLAHHSDDTLGLSAASKSMLDCIDILSYFFKSFFFSPSISNVFAIYLYIEERNLVSFFPAGGVKVSSNTNIDFKTRPWFSNTLASFLLTNRPTFVISGPYIDLTSGLKILTYSMPIVKDSDPTTISGIMNVDVIVNQFSSVYDSIQTQEDTVAVAFIDLKSNLIINNCFNSSILITFFQTNITGFSLQNWNDIQNVTKYPIDSTFILTNALGVQYYIARSIIEGEINSQSQYEYMLIVFGKQTDYLSYRSTVEDHINESFFDFIIYLIIALSIIWAFGYVYIFYLARHIVQPLSKLSTLAKGVYKSTDRKRTSDDLKDTLGKIQGPDSDMKRLIESFINLVDQHSGIRKRAVNPQPFSENESIFPVFGNLRDQTAYPINYFQKGELEPLQYEIEKLKNLNLEEVNDQSIDQDHEDMLQVKEALSQRSLSKNVQDISPKRSDSEAEIFDEISLSGLSENDTCIKDEYFYRLKQKILEFKDNPLGKKTLSQQILSTYLPKNTQSI